MNTDKFSSVECSRRVSQCAIDGPLVDFNELKCYFYTNAVYFPYFASADQPAAKLSPWPMHCSLPKCMQETQDQFDCHMCVDYKDFRVYRRCQESPGAVSSKFRLMAGDSEALGLHSGWAANWYL